MTEQFCKDCVFALGDPSHCHIMTGECPRASDWRCTFPRPAASIKSVCRVTGRPDLTATFEAFNEPPPCAAERYDEGARCGATARNFSPIPPPPAPPGLRNVPGGQFVDEGTREVRTPWPNWFRVTFR